MLFLLWFINPGFVINRWHILQEAGLFCQHISRRDKCENKKINKNQCAVCLHNQRGWWDCYGSACQSAFQIVSHSLWSNAWEGEEKKTGSGRLKTQDDAETAVADLKRHLSPLDNAFIVVSLRKSSLKVFFRRTIFWLSRMLSPILWYICLKRHSSL